jgi:hypothetical protein
MGQRQADKTFDACCKDMATAMSFPNGRHFFVEEGALKLTVAKTPVQGGGEAVLESVVRFCPFCGRPVQLRI